MSKKWPTIVSIPWPSDAVLRYVHPHKREQERARVVFVRLLMADRDGEQAAGIAQKLGCEWLTRAVAQWQKRPGTLEPLQRGFQQIPTWTTAISLEVELRPDTAWSDIRDDVIAEVKRQFDAARDEMRKSEGLGQRDKSPWNLERDVKFLYQRIVLGWSDLVILSAWNDANPKDDLTYQHVRGIISKTAKLLDIKLL